MQAQFSVLGYKIDFHFHDYKLAIEIEGHGHSDRKIDYEMRRRKAIEQELGCEFIRIDPGEEKDFYIFIGINEIFIHIKQSTKKVRLKLFDFVSYKSNRNVLCEL